MIILGIDPGTATMGFSIIKTEGNQAEALDYGVISTDKKLDDAERLFILYTSLQEIITTYKPTTIAVESLFFFKNAKTIITVAQARGVVLLAGRTHNLELFEFTPLQIKQALTGHGRAEKLQVQTMVKTILHLSEIPKPDDAADALAVALCCHTSYSYLTKTK